MAHSGSFKVPTMVAQDLAIIMEFVDPPQPQTNHLSQNLKAKFEGGRNDIAKVKMESDDDIGSSGTESEDEVEAEIASGSGPDTIGVVKSPAAVKSDESDSDYSDSESSSSTTSSSFHRPNGKFKSRPPPVIDIDLDEDGPPPPNTYVPSAHELPPTAIPVPPLPDPSTLPLDPLERIGEIATVLPDTVIVRGGGASGTGHLSARERRDATLDEGSLLLFQDRSLLGYVSETFGPTALPHYVVRINRREDNARISASDPPALDEPVESLQPESVPEATSTEALLESSSSHPPGPDPAKLLVSQAVYHIPSLSSFVFPGALARLKGSDASNVHDEEPADYELEFSDDEAEAAHKRLRKNSSSRASSRAPSAVPFEEGDSISIMGDDAGSMYGASPYDFENIPVPFEGAHSVPTSPMDMTGSSSSTTFSDPAIRDALMLARNSRTRRPSSASAPDTSPIAGPSRPREDAFSNDRGRGRGRGRGNDRTRGDRGRGRGSRGRGRGRGQGHAPGVPSVDRDFSAHAHAQAQDQGSSFSFEEYDPHMPRPPSPTSVAIARATGQWADGTPFPYQSGPGDTAPDASIVARQPVQPYEHTQMSYQAHGYYDPTSFDFSQAQQHMQAPQYGVAPHINPRFAQAFGYPGAATPTSAPSFQLPAFHYSNFHEQSGPSPDQGSGPPTEGE